MITDVIDYSFGSKHPTLLKSYQRGVEAKDSKELNSSETLLGLAETGDS